MANPPGSSSTTQVTHNESDLADQVAAVTTAGNDTTEYRGFFCVAPGTGSTWTVTFVNGGSVTFTPEAGKEYKWHVSAINTTGVTGPSYIGYVE